MYEIYVPSKLIWRTATFIHHLHLPPSHFASTSPPPPPPPPSFVHLLITMASGLSRRRVAAPSSSTHPDDDDRAPSSSGPSLSASRHNSTSNVHDAPRSAGGTAFERGSKIAYDPRDLDGANEDEAKIGGKVPRLTIMEEVLLLGIKDRQVSTFPT